MKKHFSLLISGHVQGVGFRYHVLQTAIRMNISGFVRNLPNGDVSIEAEGTPDQLDAFMTWIRQGPSGARVKNVRIIEGKSQNYEGFEIAG